MWSVNTSVARVIISFTVFGILFYLGIVAAGTSSYECPFQTPASTALRHLRDSETIRKVLMSLSPLKAISLTYTTWKNTWQGLISASRRIYDVTRSPPSWEFSMPRIRSGIRSTTKKVGDQSLILLLRIDRAFGNAKHRLFQWIRRFRRAVLLPVTTEDTHHQPRMPQNGHGLRVPLRNLATFRKQEADDVRCVSWVLRNITDPEAIDSAVILAGVIQWFNGDPDQDPPFDLIVSTFEGCFDSTKQLYPGMMDRAANSARAILQINAGARV
jgi:hypothetical protein